MSVLHVDLTGLAYALLALGGLVAMLMPVWVILALDRWIVRGNDEAFERVRAWRPEVAE